MSTVNVNINVKSKRMHWIFFLIIGWWLGTAILCLVVPLLFKAGRQIIVTAYGYY